MMSTNDIKSQYQSITASLRCPMKKETSGPVPYGLKAMIKELSREVLRQKPENVYEFLADYVEEKILKRDGKQVDVIVEPKSEGRRNSWDWMIWSSQGSSELTEEELQRFLEDINVDYEKASKAAILIQSGYRGFQARKSVKEIKNEKSRLEEVWNLWTNPGNLAVNSADIEFILSHYGLTLEEATFFATKIEALVRGYLYRTGFAHKNPELAAHLRKAGVSHEEAHEHATKIQKLFRGYKARKELKSKKLEDQRHLIAHLQGKDEEEKSEKSGSHLTKVDIEIEIEGKSEVPSKKNVTIALSSSSLKTSDQHFAQDDVPNKSEGNNEEMVLPQKSNSNLNQSESKPNVPSPTEAGTE